MILIIIGAIGGMFIGGSLLIVISIAMCHGNYEKKKEQKNDRDK